MIPLVNQRVADFAEKLIKLGFRFFSLSIFLIILSLLFTCNMADIMGMAMVMPCDQYTKAVLGLNL